MPRLIAFDADDTLRRTTVAGQPCPHAADQWTLLPGVPERLRSIRWKRAGDPGPGVFLAVASNQDHVGYGLLSHELAVALIRDALAAALGRDVPEAHVEICPHRVEDRCACRKPEPGMLLAILGRFGVEARDALFVGNAACDREAAGRAGVRFERASDFFAQP